MRIEDKHITFEKPFNVVGQVWYSNEWLKTPIKMWLSRIEEDALEQYYNIARLPFVFRVAAMPDSHLGYGMPIGGVLATKGYIVPNAVGVDIGCGMYAIRTNLRYLPREVLIKIRRDIKKLVPVGFKKHSKPQEGMPNWNQRFVAPSVVTAEWENAERSLGTLGGGNHFIEIQRGDDGFIYVMIHSGSRNLGKKIADHYNKLAVEKNEEWFSSVPKKWQLAFLPIHSAHGRHYQNEMEYAVRFAFANRLLMMDRVEEAFRNHVTDVRFFGGDAVNIAHNFARMENHFGENVMVHRKGATPAYKDELGIIPGSQRTPSYIVRGKGNKESMMSCSHGAGRKMGRIQARKTLDLDIEKAAMDAKGILHDIQGKKNLDEAGGAYKDIDDVMAHQSNLVDIVRRLEPMAVVKG